MPDDILYVRHNGWARYPLIFLVSLDPAGKVSSLRPISGFSLYLNRLDDQIRQFAFRADLFGKTFVLRIKDPIHDLMRDTHLYHTGVCTLDSDLRSLYQLGAIFWRSKDNIAASHCYKYILDRNPSSVAARYGVARICIADHDPCEDWYLRGLVVSNPEFIEAREEIASERSRTEGDAAYVAELNGILKLELPLAERVLLLSQQALVLKQLNRIDDAIPVIQQWKAAATELMGIYPHADPRCDFEAQSFGLLEEAKGLYEEAAVTYRLAARAEAFNRFATDAARYEIDLGLARALQDSSHTQEATELCNKWKTKWKKLVNKPVHYPWERRLDGVGELKGRWEFSCGNPESGFELIEATARKYPESDAPYTALAQYYYSIGEIDKAREAEATAARLSEAWARKLGEF